MNLHPNIAILLGKVGIMDTYNATCLVYKEPGGKISKTVSFKSKKHLREVKT